MQPSITPHVIVGPIQSYAYTCRYTHTHTHTPTPTHTPPHTHTHPTHLCLEMTVLALLCVYFWESLVFLIQCILPLLASHLCVGVYVDVWACVCVGGVCMRVNNYYTYGSLFFELFTVSLQLSNLCFQLQGQKWMCMLKLTSFERPSAL